MGTHFLGALVSRRPGWVVAVWVAAAVAACVFSPNLTRLAAEGQANLLGSGAESLRASEALRAAWPDQAYESLVVAALYRKEGLLAVDFGYARRLTQRIEAADRPHPVLRVRDRHRRTRRVARRRLRGDPR